MIHFIDKFSDTLHEIIKVISINLGSIFLSLNIGLTIDIFARSDSFFHDTQNIWKAIAPIGAFIYTLYKIASDVYDRIKKRNINKRSKSSIK